MKKGTLLLLLISLLFISGCKLVITTNTTQATTNDLVKSIDQIIGFKVYQYNDFDHEVLTDSSSIFKYHMSDTKTIVFENTFFSNGKFNVKEEENKTSIDISTDFNVVFKENTCFNLAFVYELVNGDYEYEKTGYDYCASSYNIGMSLSINKSEKINNYEKSVNFKVTLKNIDQLKSYTVIQYDQEYRILKEESFDLTTLTANQKNAITLNSQTIDFKIIEHFIDHDGKEYEKIKLYTRNDFKNRDKLYETVYSYDEDLNRLYYTFEYKYPN